MKNEPFNEPVKQSIKSVKDSRKSFTAQFHDLIDNGITKFFGDNLQASYKEWFDATFENLNKDSPAITKKFVLVKVKCKDPSTEYRFTSTSDQNQYKDQQTHLNIFKKGLKHENTEVFILHPKFAFKGILMKKDRISHNCHTWSVNIIPEEYIGEDGYFIVLCLKKK